MCSHGGKDLPGGWLVGRRCVGGGQKGLVSHRGRRLSTGGLGARPVLIWSAAQPRSALSRARRRAGSPVPPAQGRESGNACRGWFPPRAVPPVTASVPG